MTHKTHKRKKASRMQGRGMGTHGSGSRKNNRKSGNRGGKGMAGTGKRADQKKTLITKLYGNDYFGKEGVKRKKPKIDAINLRDIELNLGNYLKKGIAKSLKDGIEIDLSNHKILGDGDLKQKLIIKAKAASKASIDKVTKLGGEIILPKQNKKVNDKTTQESNVPISNKSEKMGLDQKLKSKLAIRKPKVSNKEA